MKKGFILFLGFITIISLASCGGSDSAAGDDGGEQDATPTARDSEVSTVVGGAAIGSMQASSDEGMRAGMRAITLAKQLAKNKAGKEVVAETFTNETFYTDCPLAGTMTFDMSGSVYADEDALTGGLDFVAAITFDQCESTEDITTTDDVACTLSASIDGDLILDFSGDIAFSQDLSDYDMSVDFSFYTAETCSGLTVTFDGTDYTVGFHNVGATVTSIDDDPVLSGTICVDGVEYSIEDIEAMMDDYESTELLCE